MYKDYVIKLLEKAGETYATAQVMSIIIFSIVLAMFILTLITWKSPRSKKKSWYKTRVTIMVLVTFMLTFGLMPAKEMSDSIKTDGAFITEVERALNLADKTVVANAFRSTVNIDELSDEEVVLFYDETSQSNKFSIVYNELKDGIQKEIYVKWLKTSFKVIKLNF